MKERQRDVAGRNAAKLGNDLIGKVLSGAEVGGARCVFRHYMADVVNLHCVAVAGGKTPEESWRVIKAGLAGVLAAMEGTHPDAPLNMDEVKTGEGDKVCGGQ